MLAVVQCVLKSYFSLSPKWQKVMGVRCTPRKSLFMHSSPLRTSYGIYSVPWLETFCHIVTLSHWWGSFALAASESAQKTVYFLHRFKMVGSHVKVLGHALLGGR